MLSSEITRIVELSKQLTVEQIFVVMASFLGQALFAGLPCSNGILYIELKSFYDDVPSSSLIWIVSTHTAIITIGCPVASQLCEFFSFRICVVIGVVLQTIGYISSSFVTNVYILYLTYSIVGGLANALIYLPSCVVLSLHFHKYRRRVIAIASSGSGFGILIFPPVLELIIRKYAWKGAMIILAGFSLNGLVCMALMQIKNVSTSESGETKEDDEMKDFKCMSACSDISHMTGGSHLSTTSSHIPISQSTLQSTFSGSPAHLSTTSSHIPISQSTLQSMFSGSPAHLSTPSSYIPISQSKMQSTLSESPAHKSSPANRGMFLVGSLEPLMEKDSSPNNSPMRTFLNTSPLHPYRLSSDRMETKKSDIHTAPSSVGGSLPPIDPRQRRKMETPVAKSPLGGLPPLDTLPPMHQLSRQKVEGRRLVGPITSSVRGSLPPIDNRSSTQRVISRSPARAVETETTASTRGSLNPNDSPWPSVNVTQRALPSSGPKYSLSSLTVGSRLQAKSIAAGQNRQYTMACILSERKMSVASAKGFLKMRQSSLVSAYIDAEALVEASRFHRLTSTTPSSESLAAGEANVCCNCYVLSRIFTRLNFYLFFLAEIAWSVGSFQFFQLLPVVAEQRGIPAPSAALLLTGLGAGSLIGRLSCVLWDYINCLSGLTSFGLMTLISSLPVLLVPFASTFPFFMFISCAYGLVLGIQGGNIAPAVVEVFSVELVVQAYGWCLVGEGIGGIVGSPIAGFIYDLTGRYDEAFYLSFSLTLCGGSVLLFIKLRHNLALRRLAHSNQSEV